MRRVAPGALGIVLLAGCGGAGPAGPAKDGGAASLDGIWRVVLDAPGGDLPFSLRLQSQVSPPAVALNGREEAPFTSVERQGAKVILRIDGYDSQIVARLSRDERRMEGEWSKTVPGGRSRLRFHAEKGRAERFLAPPGPARNAGSLPGVDGTWAVVFTDEDGEAPARGQFRQEGARVVGTFLTPTGDDRYLEGDYRAGTLRLSCFDGGHVFLFQARAGGDGTLKGDFWSRDSYHATWVAHRVATAAAAPLPDPYRLVGLTNEAGRFRFSFPDLEGHRVSWDDPRFHGKVVLVNLFGSWCPNCNDEAPLLARWWKTKRRQGLEMVGLAFECTGDADRDGAFVRKYARRHGIDYPLLLAGVSDKAAAAAVLPDLDRVAAYPTNVFIGRDGRVRRIHSGFAGPATGRAHQELVADFERLLDALLAEPAPEGG